MATFEYTLSEPPSKSRARELWLQHAAGFILFEDARNYAISKIPKGTGQKTKEKIIEGIDDSIYGLMMIFDGVSGSLRSPDYQVTLDTSANLIKVTDTEEEIIDSVKLQSGDGMCIGYHGWLEEDFGTNPIIKTS